MEYKSILNRPTLNNFLAIGNERRQKCPMSDQMDAFVYKYQMVTHKNTDYLKRSFQVQNTCNSGNVNIHYICRESPTGKTPNMDKG